MGKPVDLLFSREKKYTQLAYVNSKAIVDYNIRILSALSLTGGILILLPILAAPFSKTKPDAIPAYLLSAILLFAMFFIFKRSSMKKYVLVGLYIYFSAFFMLAIFLSVIHTPNMRATILLGSLCLMPLGFIDHPVRMNLLEAFWLVIHTILSFFLKPQYVVDDLINCLCFAILGCFIGNIVVIVRLESYEANRLLNIEKETDVLTGLLNRRKLYETLIALESTNTEKPSGILMIDVDHFKDFNDNYGHAAGDQCLSRLGEVFTKHQENLRLHFYRYGGEEFVAIAYGCAEEELLSIAESLRIAVQSADMDGHHITVSIGAAYCGAEKIKNYEKVIDRADKAVYTAKNSGRNKVCSDH